MNHADLPTPNDLVNCPELAILAVLETALHLSVRALVAPHPQLQSQDAPYWCRDRSRAFIIAGSIVELALALSEQVERYRALLPPDPPGPQLLEDDIPS